MELPKEAKSFFRKLSSGDKGKKEEIIEFRNQPPTPAGRQASCQVLHEREGVRGPAKDVRNPRDAFNLFIIPSMVDMIAAATNKVIDKKLRRHRNHLLSDKYPFLHETSQDEIYALIGLMLYRGLYSVTSISAHVLFLKKRSPDVYCNRFNF